MCPHRLHDGALVCQRTDPHDPDATGGHVYHGRDVDDHKHDDRTDEA